VSTAPLTSSSSSASFSSSPSSSSSASSSSLSLSPSSLSSSNLCTSPISLDPTIVFETLIDLEHYLFDYASRSGFSLTVESSQNLTLPLLHQSRLLTSKPNVKVPVVDTEKGTVTAPAYKVLRCERSGIARQKESGVESKGVEVAGGGGSSTTAPRSTRSGSVRSSKKTNCPFQLNVSYHKTTMRWTINTTVLCHNHPLQPDRTGSANASGGIAGVGGGVVLDREKLKQEQDQIEKEREKKRKRQTEEKINKKTATGAVNTDIEMETGGTATNTAINSTTGTADATIDGNANPEATIASSSSSSFVPPSAPAPKRPRSTRANARDAIQPYPLSQEHMHTRFPRRNAAVGGGGGGGMMVHSIGSGTGTSRTKLYPTNVIEKLNLEKTMTMATSPVSSSSSSSQTTAGPGVNANFTGPVFDGTHLLHYALTVEQQEKCPVVDVEGGAGEEKPIDADTSLLTSFVW